MRSSCRLTVLGRLEGRGNAIETYKLMTVKAVVPYEEFSSLADCISTRGHNTQYMQTLQEEVESKQELFLVQGF